MLQFSDEFLDNHVATKLSQLTKCEAPEVASLEPSPILFGLNQMLGARRYKKPIGILFSIFMIRLKTAIAQYQAGKSSLEIYIAALPEHKVAEFQQALSYFESVILHTSVAIRSLNATSKILHIQNLFTKNDGSDYDQLNKLNNRIKHFDEDVEANAIYGKAIIYPRPVWIIDKGLESIDSNLSFRELADILIAQSVDAKEFFELLKS